MEDMVRYVKSDRQRISVAICVDGSTHAATDEDILY